MEIKGIEARSIGDIETELEHGGKFVLFTWVISALIVTFKRPTAIYYVPPGHGTAGKAAAPTIVTLLLGLWGIPWGPIYTVQALISNLRGGKDVTEEVKAHFAAAKAAEAGAIAPGPAGTMSPPPPPPATQLPPPPASPPPPPPA